MIESLLGVRYNFVSFVDNLFGLGLEWSVWFILIILIILIILFILYILLKYFNKKNISLKKELVYEYDKIFYLLSLFQYQSQSDTSIIISEIIRSVISIKKPNYVSSYLVIRNKIKEVETLLGKEIVSVEMWTKINQLRKKLSFSSLFYKILKIILLLILLSAIIIILYIFNI